MCHVTDARKEHATLYTHSYMDFYVYLHVKSIALLLLFSADYIYSYISNQ